MLLHVVGLGSVLRQKLPVSLPAHHFAVLAHAVNGRIQNHDAPARPQATAASRNVLE